MPVPNPGRPISTGICGIAILATFLSILYLAFTTRNDVPESQAALDAAAAASARQFPNTKYYMPSFARCMQWENYSDGRVPPRPGGQGGCIEHALRLAPLRSHAAHIVALNTYADNARAALGATRDAHSARNFPAYAFFFSSFIVSAIAFRLSIRPLPTTPVPTPIPTPPVKIRTDHRPRHFPPASNGSKY